MNYPDNPGYAQKSETSKQAASRLTCQSELHILILSELSDHGATGLIVDEALPIVINKMQRHFDRSTVAARFTEMKIMGLIETSDLTRLTPKNRSASVFVINQNGLDWLRKLKGN